MNRDSTLTMTNRDSTGKGLASSCGDAPTGSPLPLQLLAALLDDHQRAHPHHHDVCEICRATSTAIEAAMPQKLRVMIDRETEEAVAPEGPLGALMARIDDTWTLWEQLTRAQADVKRMMAEIETANGRAA